METMTKNEKYLLTINEQRLLFERIYSANRALESKAGTLIQAGSLITGLISAAKVATGTLQGVSLYILVAVLVLFIAMLLLSINVWQPGNKVAPGSTDWDNLYNNHIHAEDEEDLKLTLANYLDAVNAALKRNDRHGTLISIAGYCLVVQIVALVILLFVS